jgi:hypothetical protein
LDDDGANGAPISEVHGAHSIIMEPQIKEIYKLSFMFIFVDLKKKQT